MSLILGILLTLLVFSLVVFIHELGHFLVARASGMKVEEFGIGIPPRAKTLFQDKHGTIYTINWLPIGGFVRIAGENESEESTTKGSFATKSWLAQSAVLLAGVTMNFLFAFLIFFSLFLSGAKPLGLMPLDTSVSSYFLISQAEAEERGILSSSGDILFSPLSGSIAENAGIQSGDRFRGMIASSSLSGCTQSDFSSCTTEEIITEIEKNQPLTFFLENGSGSIREIMIQPENGKIGSYIYPEIYTWNDDFTYPTSFGSAFVMAGTELYAELSLTAQGLGMLVQKFFAPKYPEEQEEAREMLSGPIGIGSMFVEAVDQHISPSILIFLIAMISLSLGFFNLLPIPGLDGGRFVTLSLSKLTGALSGGRVSIHGLETWLNTVGLLLLIGLSILVAFLDIMKFF